MSDDERPFTPSPHTDTGGVTPEEPDAREGEATGGKLIHEDVFLSRLAERRQAEQEFAGGEASVIDTILGALEDIGLDPNTIAPDFVRMSRAASQAESVSPDADSRPPSLEDMALEEQFLSELRAGLRPSLSAYMRRHAAEKEALLRLAVRMDPRDLVGLDAPETLTPEREEAGRAGQDEGTRRALREIAKRGAPRPRSAPRRVAEEQSPYTTGQRGGEGEAKPKRGRARPARPEESGPER